MKFRIDDRVVLTICDPPKKFGGRRKIRYVRGTVLNIKKLGSNTLLDVLDDENCRHLINKAQVSRLNALEWLTEV